LEVLQVEAVVGVEAVGVEVNNSNLLREYKALQLPKAKSDPFSTTVSLSES